MLKMATTCTQREMSSNGQANDLSIKHRKKTENGKKTKHRLYKAYSRSTAVNPLEKISR